MAGDVNEAFPEQTVCQTDVAARVVRVAHLGLVVEMAMRVLADADRTAVMARMEQMAYPEVIWVPLEPISLGAPPTAQTVLMDAVAGVAAAAEPVWAKTVRS